MAPRPSSSRRNKQQHQSGDGIDKLEYQPGGRPLLHTDDVHNGESSGRVSEDRSYAGSFFEDVAEGIAIEDQKYKTREVLRFVSFIWAIVSCLGAGSITAYSLYAPLFQRRLHYTQLQVNGVSIAAELAVYLPVPLIGMLCDRTGPGLPSLLSGVCLGLGYFVAAFAYRSGPPAAGGGDGWPYWVMVVAFVFIGFGTSCMYLSAITTCAKNFGRGRFRGLALALPISCFGLSSMWQSQVGSRLLYEPLPDGSRGDVDVYRFFLFLGCLLLATGLLGLVLLRLVDEDVLIDEAVDELERSGLLQDSEFFHSSATGDSHQGYGTTNDSFSANENHNSEDQDRTAHLLEDKRKKTWLLNEETRRFVHDHTAWWLAAGFFLVTGPGEAFINNLGTIIGTLYTPESTAQAMEMTSAATHVSIVALSSTICRILTGSLTDLVAPTTPLHQHRQGPSSLANSMASLGGFAAPRRLEISRVTLLLTFCLIMAAGQVTLASGVLQDRGDLFWIVSSTAGAGYGAAFSLTPIIVSVVWGVENFGTNWGIISTAAAVGATFWGLVYSAVYQRAAATTDKADRDEILCYGRQCYAPTFWAMAVSVVAGCGMLVWAWRGPGGWMRRGVAV
nr:putative transporter mch1 [Quercus suber]